MPSRGQAVYFDIRPSEDRKDTAETLSSAEELSGSLKPSDEGLMRSVLESDKETVDNGKLIESALDMGINSFMPDLMFDQLVKDYRLAAKIYGERMLKLLSGYDSQYIERNMKIPEFQRLLKQRIEEKLSGLQADKLLDSRFSITEKGLELASLVMYTEELDNIIPKGSFGERIHKKASHYGSKEDIKSFRKGDRYRDIAMRKTIKSAIRRGHQKIIADDLKAFERQSKGQCHIIYALDASGSMKGAKIGSCKKAGIALAYKAIMNKDKVGLIVFGDEIKASIEPTLEFPRIIKAMVGIRASNQTDIVKTIRKAIELFPPMHATKHLILLTDALPTAGREPEKETLDAVSIARNAGITLSLVGIGLDRKGEHLALRMIEIGGGKLYKITDLKDVDKIVLEEYDRIA